MGLRSYNVGSVTPLIILETGGDMKEIDKNDVDISKLFVWGKKFKISIPGKTKHLDVYMRLIGDADYNRATVFARRKSAELRRLLKDPESDESMALIPDITTFSNEILIDTLLLFYTKEITVNAIREIRIDLPAEPKFEASLEEMEQYQAEVDAYPKKREEKIKEFVLNKMEIKRAELQEKDPEYIYSEYIRLVTNQLCETEMVSKLKQMITYLGTYKDPEYTERLFSSFEEFDNLPETTKNDFLDLYTTLEIDGEELKK